MNYRLIFWQETRFPATNKLIEYEWCMLYVCVLSRVLTLEKEVLEAVQPMERKLHSKWTRVAGAFFDFAHGWLATLKMSRSRSFLFILHKWTNLTCGRSLNTSISKKVQKEVLGRIGMWFSNGVDGWRFRTHSRSPSWRQRENEQITSVCDLGMSL